MSHTESHKASGRVAKYYISDGWPAVVRALGLKNGDRVQLELLSRDPCRLRLSLLQAEERMPSGLTPAPPSAAPGPAWSGLASESESISAPKPPGGEDSSESESVAAPLPTSAEGGGAWIGEARVSCRGTELPHLPPGGHANSTVLGCVACHA